LASFFDEIEKNRIRSMVLMSLFSLLFIAVIYLLIDVFFGGGIFGLVFGVLVAVAYAAFVYSAGDKMILRVSGAKPADKNKYPILYEIVDGISSASQIPMPKVYVIEDQNPNAFATGRNKKASSIAVTTGLLNAMSRTELEGVIAHEASHIYNNDIQFMMVAVVFAGAIGLASVFIRNILFFGGDRRGNNGMLFIVAIIVGLLAPFFALLLRLAISRRREYMADANGARITRDPGSLANALIKIQAYGNGPHPTSVKHANEINSSLYFANPFNKKAIANLFSTHPPIDERIKRLQKMY
jgi:heat shock protein HtpX